MICQLSVMAFVFLLCQYVASQPTIVVKTSIGPVQGEILSTFHSTKYAAFRGIRYAEPPIGQLRFKPPVPRQPRRWTLNATIERNVCPQLGPDSKIIGSEDCLFLNVFTPVTFLKEPPTSLKAVMVWIHGGNFVEGSGNTDLIRPDFLLEKDVVFVSFNYRLGALGFLSLNHREATGNQGLKDQILALRWVRKNIKKFGGDPQRVTIFGENAGAASVGYHVLSDASKGVFHGAISMSGTPLSPWAFQSKTDAVNQGIALARLIVDLQSAFSFEKEFFLEILNAATPEELVAYTFQGKIKFTPTLENPKKTDEVFLAQCSMSKYKSGEFNKVPQILGSMDQKVYLYRFYKNDWLKLFGWIFKFVNYATREWFKPWIDNLVTGDVLRDPVDDTQQLLATKNGKNPIYYYLMTISLDTSPQPVEGKDVPDGIEDVGELAFIFYIPSNNYNLSVNSPMSLAIDRVSTMWTNFAKYGKPIPNLRGVTRSYWPASGLAGSALEIDEKLTLIPRPIHVFAEAIHASDKSFLQYFADC